MSHVLVLSSNSNALLPATHNVASSSAPRRRCLIGTVLRVHTCDNPNTVVLPSGREEEGLEHGPIPLNQGVGIVQANVPGQPDVIVLRVLHVVEHVGAGPEPLPPVAAAVRTAAAACNETALSTRKS